MKITLHMVSSLDGYIANEAGTYDWLQSIDTFELGKELTNDDIDNFLRSVDCYIMGSHTYEQAIRLGWPYGNKPVIVMSKRKFSSLRENVEFYDGDLNSFRKNGLSSKFTNIWMVGGSQLTKAFIKEEMVDEIVISIMPILLGGGIPFFNNLGLEKHLHLKNVSTYKDGMVELTYEVLKR